jgi:hypothetical protein
MATSFARDHQKRNSPQQNEADFYKALSSQLPERTMAALRTAGAFDTPPRQQAGRSIVYQKI